jgi:hypothetical protein
MWAETVAFDMPDPGLTSITESVNALSQSPTILIATHPFERSPPTTRKCGRTQLRYSQGGIGDRRLEFSRVTFGGKRALTATWYDEEKVEGFGKGVG